MTNNNRMTDKEVIINNCNVSKCKYYTENNGVYHQGLYQYTDMCYKLPYDNCENKPFCWYKIISRMKRIIYKLNMILSTYTNLKYYQQGKGEINEKS